MKKRLCFLLSFICAVTFAQNENPTKLYGTVPLEVVEPFEVDTVNADGNKTTAEEMLKLRLNIPPQSAFVKEYKADTTGFFHLETIAGKTSVQFVSFYVHAEEYGKAKVEATSPGMMEIYVDNELALSKKTAEESQSLARTVSATLKPYPKASRVIIKLLTEDGHEAALKIKITDEKNGAARNLSVTESPRRRMVLDDAIRGKRVSNTSISSGGNYVLISYTDNHGEKSYNSTELYCVKNGRRVWIDRDRQKQQLQWMPVSEKLCYVSKNGTASNLVSIHPETLEESVIADDIPDERITLSPDEKAVYYAKSPGPRGEKDGDVFRLHTLTDRSGRKPAHSFIYRHDLHTGQTRQLTFGSHATYLNDISRDGKFILFSIADETITERPFSRRSMFRLNIPTMQVDTLWKDEKYASGAGFSPDGKKILITGSAESFGGIGLDIDEGQTANLYDTQAFIMDLETKRITPVTKKFNPAIQQGNWHENGLIYFKAEDEDRVKIYTYRPSDGKFTALPVQEDVVEQFAVARSAPVMVYCGVSVSNSTRAYLVQLKSTVSALIADPYGEHLNELLLGEVKDWSFVNSDGTEIKGYYFLPPGFDANRKYPMIVNYYGGTSPIERRFESRYPMHVYAALGYVVYVLQPSGATGFGQRFSAMHVNTWGIRSSDDIIEGTTKFIETHPFVDRTKIGCIGASYGGFMTMYLQTRTDLFAAAVSHAGISSISSYWGEGYWGYSYSAAASAGSYPWNNRDLYVNQSPLFHADRINTPILLVHGTADTNVPPGESIQMYTALKILGKTAELIQVEGENHHILDYKKRLKWNESIFAWFERWLKDDADWWNDLYKN
ncbi:MAG: prolyl oligopeptidase family serine peptidase [Tannerella sp.]|jgi:dipeptidyl aminopeptidase/acylaminoacyl peptidase|nr:prolyl oligopeptidase family serine peptidase [Tannerella sp.]